MYMHWDHPIGESEMEQRISKLLKVRKINPMKLFIEDLGGVCETPG
jgi:hypothetical protein